MQLVRRHFSTLDSTIQWAKEHLDALDRKNITLITADHQTAGIGSQGRKWISPKNQNISASFCFFLQESRIDLLNLPQILQLTVAQVLEQIEFAPKIKWPNDLLLSGKKVAGVLCHTFEHDAQVCIILSIGLNVNSEPKSLDRIDQPATSLFIEGKEVLDRESLTQSISKDFQSNLEIFLKDGFSPFTENFRSRLNLKKGDPLTLSGYTGTFESINDDGSLNLKLSSGLIKQLY